jgi:chromosome segregation ATPase
MLRRRSGSATKAAEQRLAHAEQSRDALQAELAQRGQELKEVQLRILHLEGAPAARAHVARARELEAAHARLKAAEDSAAFDQEALRDRAAELEREVGLLRFSLQQVEESAAARDAERERALAALQESRVQQAEERRQRYLYEDRLRAAEARVSDQAVDAELSAAQSQLRTAATISDSRSVELGQLRGELAAERSVNEVTRHELAGAKETLRQRDESLQEAHAALQLITASLAEEGGGGGGDGGGGAGGGGGTDEPSGVTPGRGEFGALVSRVHVLRGRMHDNDALRARAASAQAARDGAQAAAADAESRAAAAEEERTTCERELASAQAALEKLGREREAPVASVADALREKEDELTELREGAVPLLRAQLVGTQQGLERAEKRLVAEREQRGEASAQAARAHEERRALQESLALAEARASAADAARHSVAAELSRLRAHRVHKGKAVPYPPPLFLHPPPTIPNTG